MLKSVIPRKSIAVRSLAGELRQLIESARQAAHQSVNQTLVGHYWQVGARIRQDILAGGRAGYGEQIVASLSRQLVPDYGRGYSAKSLHHMVRFAEAFPDAKIVASLWRQLSWSHFRVLSYMTDPLKREFYAALSGAESWSVRELRSKVNGALYERTALSRKPAKVISRELAAIRESGKPTPDAVFKDPYVLDFLELKDAYQEKDLEAAIMRELESFILEMGKGFAFVERQKRIQVDGDDYYLDLLFYHRGLRRLVAVELKLGAFEPAHKGQMELYLRWLERYEKQPGEEPPIGLILCAGKKQEQVELMELEKSGIKIASYITKLLPPKLLRKKLHQAMVNARAHVVRQAAGQGD